MSAKLSFISIVAIIFLLGSSVFGQDQLPAAMRPTKVIEPEIEKSRQASESVDQNIAFRESALGQIQLPPKKVKRLLKRGGNSADFLGLVTVLFSLFSILGLISVIFIGWWGFLISFGCLILAAIFFLMFFNASRKSSAAAIIGLIFGIIAFSAGAILNVLVLLVYSIIQAFN